MRYAEVAVDVPVRPRLAADADVDGPGHAEPLSAFHYSVPPHLESLIAVGQWVWVPFGSRSLGGIVVALDSTPPDVEIRPIADLIDVRPVLSAAQLALARWISDRYLASLYECLGLFLPPGASPRTETVYALRDVDAPRLTPSQRDLVALLREEGPLTLAQIEKRLIARAQAEAGRASGKRSGIVPGRTIDSLVRRGMVERRSYLVRGKTGPRYEDAVRLRLTPEEAWRAVAASLAHSAAQRLLLRLAAAQEAGDPLVGVAELLADAAAGRRTLLHLAEQNLAFVTAESVVLSAVDATDARVPPPLRSGPRSLEELAAAGVTAAAVRGLVQQGLLAEHALPETAALAAPAGDAYRDLVADAGGPLVRALEALLRHPGALWVRDLMALAGCSRATITRLRQAGVVMVERRRVFRDPLVGLDVPPRLPPPLTTEQTDAAAPLTAAIRGGDAGAFLLHGVTGSGKTEVYLQAIEETLAQGKQAIVLVPEIALTPQALRRFGARFHGRIAVQHSQLSDGERYDQWTQIRDGAADIVIGSRSALFAPLERCGLIILDEEHEPSYKQEGRPHYHARDAARELARLSGAVLVLGSATPDVCTYRAAERGQLQLLGLNDRYGSDGPAAMPPVQVVDMRQELREGHTGLCSRPLLAALADTLARSEQAILYLNRRGSATFVMCRECGYVAQCPRCNLPLTHHTGPGDPADGRLACHHCSYTQPPPRTCPECASTRIRYFGAGTERLQAYAQAQFPQARILRWDRDTTRGRGSHDAILQGFLRHEADILVGTQMVAKGLDLPLVTLVGVVAADTALFLPDFRAAERAFQLLTQVVGRSGRSELGGRAIIQTYRPDHYAVQAAAAHDYLSFYRREIAQRHALGYPPFGQMIRLVYGDGDRRRCREAAERLGARLRLRVRQLGLPNLDVIGPSPCFYARLRGRYRWHIILRGQEGLALLRHEPVPLGWRVDVDPMSFL
ncbi:MAG: replication restart helicase PriA [Anaerolineae bacterium]